MLEEHIAEGQRERIAAEARRVMAWKKEGMKSTERRGSEQSGDGRGSEQSGDERIRVEGREERGGFEK